MPRPPRSGARRAVAVLPDCRAIALPSQCFSIVSSYHVVTCVECSGFAYDFQVPSREFVGVMGMLGRVTRGASGGEGSKPMSAETLPHWCACPDGPHGCQQPYCPYYQYVVELLGRRWAGSIVRALLSGVTRFSALADTIPDLSDRMLSERLKELEEAGIVARVVFPETPVRIEYHLTERGQALRPLMDAALDWAAAWLAAPGEAGS